MDLITTSIHQHTGYDKTSLDPRSDLSLKSTEQQSQQVTGEQINYSQCQHAALFWMKAVCLVRQNASFSSTICWDRLQVISEGFQFNIVPPLEVKAHIYVSALEPNHPTSCSTALFSSRWLAFLTQMHAVPTCGVVSTWDVIRIKDIDHTKPGCASINNS